MCIIEIKTFDMSPHFNVLPCEFVSSLSVVRIAGSALRHRCEVH